ncbi:YdeI family protein [Agromyces aurantiacus]|uniref:YdeI family protein n=1 Tax=Agromyces aurantiacus TaxID=165814 RepID=A0ABV9R9R1_9MICO|nr:YdeI/OmpD-associated family protein [Agromyces aurantiacus]MBM7505099.1 uncharacterized protein YdeI (YjbR/CyaY-like superfamily) [Agromyces aurantiacus]
MGLDDAPLIQPATAAEWRDWLERHHDTATGVWVVTWRSPGPGREPLPYEDQVLEALAFGWIDATTRRLDDDRRAQYFAPRKPGGTWARSNKDRIERLRAEGRMAPAGEEAVRRAIADGSWSMLDAIDRMDVPDDLAAAFARHPGSRELWEAFPPSARRGALWWIHQAKRPATRERRVEETARLAAENVRVGSEPRREA